MESHAPSREAIVAEMQRVIELGEQTYGLTHSGPITINISFTRSGVLARYKDAFGYRPEEAPDECSFQREEHMFFAPQCRSSTRAIAKEWFVRAVGTPDVSPRWITHGTFDHFLTRAVEGRYPFLSQDRFQRALFYDQPADVARDRASEDMMTAAALYAIQRYGNLRDWVGIHSRVVAGGDADAAFEEVYGDSLAEFYAAFEAWASQEKLILVTGAFDSCEEAARNLSPRGGTVGVDAGFPDYRVPTARDHDDDGLVCEGHLPVR